MYSWPEFNGKKHGTQAWYHPNGQIGVKSLSIYGQTHGIGYSWEYNGIRDGIFHAKIGNMHGTRIYFKYKKIEKKWSHT